MGLRFIFKERIEAMQLNFALVFSKMSRIQKLCKIWKSFSNRIANSRQYNPFCKCGKYVLIFFIFTRRRQVIFYAVAENSTLNVSFYRKLWKTSPSPSLQKIDLENPLDVFDQENSLLLDLNSYLLHLLVDYTWWHFQKHLLWLTYRYIMS